MHNLNKHDKMKSPLPKKVGHRHDHVDDRPQTSDLQLFEHLD